MKILIEESVLRHALEVFEKMPFQNSEMVSNAASALRNALDAAEKVEPVARSDYRDWDYQDDLDAHPAPAVPEETK